MTTRIDSAYFGDDISFRNITESLRKKISGGKLDVTANDKLLPTFEAAPETTLSTTDEKDVQEAAVKNCGESDQKCLEVTKAKLRQEKLYEKERTNMSSANVVKGRRLTVIVVDPNGRRRTLVVPDGQQLTLDNVDGVETTKIAGVKMPSFSYFSTRMTDLLTFFGIAAFQVFGFAAFVWMVREEAPVFWQKFIQGGWFSVVLAILPALVLLAIPFGPLGAVILYYLGKGIWAELKS